MSPAPVSGGNQPPNHGYSGGRGAHWLEEQSRDVRQGFMDPVQKAAFEEFLARQPPVGEQ